MSNESEKQVYTALEDKEHYLTVERDRALVALREANEQLESMHQRMREFVSVVNHEFRSTLTTIQGFSEILCQRDLSVAEMKEFAVDIYQDAQHLSHMIDDMLNLEHMEMGRMRLHCDWLDLNTSIMEVVNRIRLTTEQHTIHVKLANALPVLMGDAEKLTRVIANLLDNALQYSPDGGEVCISSMVEGGAVHVCVQDSGIGIPADAINRIFERYERIETKISNRNPGVGLGLSLVRQILGAHGGQVWAESVLGEGSCFHFTVPFVNSPTNINGILA
jgi:signal transduction histidine kinase